MAAKRVVETVDPFSLSPGNTPATSPTSDTSPAEPRFAHVWVEDENIGICYRSYLTPDYENLVSCSRLPPLPSTSIPLASFREEEEDIETVQIVKTQLPAPVRTAEEDEQGLAPPTYKTFIKRKSQLVLSTEGLQEKLKEEANKPDPIPEKKEDILIPQKQPDAVHHQETAVQVELDPPVHSMTILKEFSEHQVLSIKQRAQQKLSSSDQLIQMIKERERVRKEEIAKRETMRKKWKSKTEDSSILSEQLFQPIESTSQNESTTEVPATTPEVPQAVEGSIKQEQPEGRNISAYMITAFMLANVFCLVYLFLQRFIGISYVFTILELMFVREKVYMYLILLGNFFLCCMITVYWKSTKDIHPFGDLRYSLKFCSNS